MPVDRELVSGFTVSKETYYCRIGRIEHLKEPGEPCMEFYDIAAAMASSQYLRTEFVTRGLEVPCVQRLDEERVYDSTCRALYQVPSPGKGDKPRSICSRICGFGIVPPNR
jgi:hypothetical protein